MRTWWIICILSIVLFSFAPTFYELKRSSDLPPNRAFELVHNYITDYNFYLSRIREGWDGRWTVVERYTNESHAGSLIQEFYLLLGKAGRIIPEPTMAVTYVYYVACFVASVLLLSLTVWAATRLFPVLFWSLLAFLLAVFACGWPIIVPVGASWRFGGYMAWFTIMDILQRVSFLPHVLVGQALVLFLVIAGNDAKTLEKKGNWIFLGLLSLILGMIFPPGLMFIGVSYGIALCVEAVWRWEEYTKQKSWQRWWTDSVMPRVVIGLISLPALLYYYAILTIYPWKRLVDFDQLHPLTVSVVEYMKALGPVFPLGVIGLVVAMWKKERLFIGIISWVLAWMLLFWVFSFVPQQSPLRFAEMTPHIPLAFLTIYVSWSLIGYAKKHSGLVYLGIIAYAIPFLYIIVGIGVMYSSWLWHRDFINQKVSAGWPMITMDNYIVYPTKGFIEGISYINYETAADSIILSDLTTGNYIPARTGRRVYVGHDGSINKETKLETVHQFYLGEMKEQDAYLWLKNAGISYVFWGPQEKESGEYTQISRIYPFLRQVFGNSEVTIYQLP